MLKKKYLKSRKISKVTFEVPVQELPVEDEDAAVHLLGDFNDWDPSATPMKYLKKGVFQAVIELEPGRDYQFRYLINGDTWCNDWAADDYVVGDYGTDNSVVRTPGNGSNEN